MATFVNQPVMVFKHRYVRLPFYVEGVSNLENCVAEFALGEGPPGAILLYKTSDAITPSITIDGVVVNVDIMPEDLVSVAADKYYYEMVITDTNGQPIQSCIGVADVRDVLIT